jgi:hypothetical protein
MVSKFAEIHSCRYSLLTAASERDANQDYEAGWKRYGFAAPFAPNSKAAKSSDIKRPPLEVQ